MFRKMITLMLLLIPASGIHAQSVWTPVPEIDRVTVNALLQHGDMLYAATASTVFRSGDNGRRWYPADSFPAATSSPDISAICNSGSRLFAATMTDGVFESTDDGVTWRAYSTGLSGLARGVISLAVSGDTLLASTNGAGLYARDIRRGTPWIAYGQGIGWSNGGSVTVFGDRWCAVVNEFSYVRSSSDAGWTWLPWTPAGFQIATPALHVHGNALFAGTKLGVFRWNGTDSLWQRLDLAPAPNRLVTAFTSRMDTLYAAVFLNLATHLLVVSSDAGSSWSVADTVQGEVFALMPAGDRFWSARKDGLWFRALDGTVSAHLPASPVRVRIEASYPQPATNEIVVEVQVAPGTGTVVLECRDLLGRLVFSDERPVTEGRVRVRADVNGQLPGLYVLSVRAGDFRDTRKILIGG